MICCSCNLLSDKALQEKIAEMLEEDPWQLIVPGKLFKALGVRGKCCGCFPNVADIIVESVAQFHKTMNSEPDRFDFLFNEMRAMKKRYEDWCRKPRCGLSDRNLCPCT